MIDLTDPKIALIHGALINVLGNRDVTKIPDYFTEDVTVIINEKCLHGFEVYNRIQWLRDNSEIKSVVITLHNAFFASTQGFDHHTSRVIYTNGKQATYKLFGYIKLRNNKICHYEIITIQQEGEKDMGVVTSTTKDLSRSVLKWQLLFKKIL